MLTRSSIHAVRAGRRCQRGLTLIEFMISMAIGLFMVAIIASLIASQSVNRAEVDRSGRLIENGRYSMKTMADELQMAGYWGELNRAPADSVIAAPMPDPCVTTLANQTTLSQLHVQGYNDPVAADVPSCVSNHHHQPGTDILVLRYADPDSSSMETAGKPDLAKLVAGQLYIQTGVMAGSSNFSGIVGFGTADATVNGNLFTLKKKDKVTAATVRRVVVRIYFVARCSVPSGGNCDAGDGGNPIPTLKMVELGPAGWSSPVAIAEGIENMQVEYGLDTDSDGTPNGDDVTTVAAPDDWKNVMTVKVHLLSRTLERSPGYVEDKTFKLGSTVFTPPDTAKAFKRHVFVQSVRLVNPGARRQS